MTPVHSWAMNSAVDVYSFETGQYWSRGRYNGDIIYTVFHKKRCVRWFIGRKCFILHLSADLSSTQRNVVSCTHSPCLSTCLPVYLPICLHVYLSTYIFVYLSTYLSVYLSTYLYVYLTISSAPCDPIIEECSVSHRRCYCCCCCCDWPFDIIRSSSGPIASCR